MPEKRTATYRHPRRGNTGYPTPRELLDVRALQIGIETPALSGRILDALDHAIAAVVHHDHDHVEFFLRRCPQTTDVQEEATAARHDNCLVIACRGGIDAQAQSLPDTRLTG
jgi:hypothetical protein